MKLSQVWFGWKNTRLWHGSVRFVKMSVRWCISFRVSGKGAKSQKKCHRNWTKLCVTFIYWWQVTHQVFKRCSLKVFIISLCKQKSLTEDLKRCAAVWLKLIGCTFLYLLFICYIYKTLICATGTGWLKETGCRTGNMIVLLFTRPYWLLHKGSPLLPYLWWISEINQKAYKCC